MFTTFIFAPMYNLLVFIVSHVPGSYMWIAVSILTLIIKLCLIPLYKKQVKDQVTIAHITPKIKQLQDKYKDSKPEDKQKMGQEMMALYKEYKVNPLMTILILIIQFPILIALYQIFLKNINTHYDLLYTFVSEPVYINNMFLGIDLSQRSLVLAIIAGVTFFVLNIFMFQKHKDNKVEETEFQKSLMLQMKYVLPLVIGAVSYFTPAVIAIYIIVGNLFGLAQEFLIKRPLESKVRLYLAKK
jgi:YidC/Oxa1 family membrane protein insertase